jgi:hypothetical protein
MVNTRHLDTSFSNINHSNEGWTGENTFKKLPPNYGSFGACNLTEKEQQDELSLFFKFIPMEFFYTLVSETNKYIAEQVKNITVNFHF